MATHSGGHANYLKYRPLVEAAINEFMQSGVAINPCSISTALGLSRNRFSQSQWAVPILQLIRLAEQSQKQGLRLVAGGHCREELIPAVVQTAIRTWNEDEALTAEDYAMQLEHLAEPEEIVAALQIATQRGFLERDERDLFTLYIPTAKAFREQSCAVQEVA